MSESKCPVQKEPGDSRLGESSERTDVRHVLACIKDASCAQAILTHAAALAKTAHARITIMHVLVSSAARSDKEPTDPVEWAQRHFAVTANLQGQLSCLNGLKADVVIADGVPGERICGWARDNAADLLVLGRGNKTGAGDDGLGDTARRVIRLTDASVLVVPAVPVKEIPVTYRKLLVPLDGSFRSESALPLSLKIAAAHGAEMILVHAAPKFELIESDLLNAEAIMLRDELHDYNERAARKYLCRLRSRLPTLQTTTTRLLPSGDARGSLVQTVMQECADLMVLSATGKGGESNMAVGGVADYLINRLHIPVLLVKQHQQNQPYVPGEICNSMDSRLPNQRRV